ncbi:exportin-T [Octopus bimaculoides]|nr:exportin-T [Octopus bimaculoides]
MGTVSVPMLGMDEQALSFLDGPHLGDGRAQEKILTYFELLKRSDDGWKLCITAFTCGKYNSDNARFFFLQVLESYLKQRYQTAGSEDQQIVREFLMTCLQMQASSVTKDKSFLKNKIAQLFSLAFLNDFPHRWPTYFSDLLQASSYGHVAIEMYLRILTAIDYDVVDREIIHSDHEADRNSNLKDAMREHCIHQLVDSWLQIMTTYQSSQPDIACLCLEVVGKFISWIDINLVANDQFVTALLTFLNSPQLRECTCDCIYEIISKGMEPVAKTKLIESFATVLNSAGVMCPNEDEEGDYMAKLAKLVNGMGQNLFSCYQKMLKTDINSALTCLQAIERKLPLVLRFLSHEDDDISEAVIGFAQDYIGLLKQSPNLTPRQRENIQVSEIYESLGEEEAMFQDYRKQVKIIFNNLAQLDSDMVLMTVHSVLSNMLSQWKTLEFWDVEMPIMLMYMLGEALPSSNQSFNGCKEKPSPLQEMMRLLVSSGVSCHKHSCVQLQVLESVVRYEKFFNTEPEYIPDVLMAFLDERGLRNKSPQVRSRAAYLFSRFVKVLKAHLQDYLEHILKQITDMLVLHSPENGCIQQLLSCDDQLFIYETVGILIVASNFPPERKRILIQKLLAPIVSKFETMLAKLCTEGNEENQENYACCINNAISFASRISKGFSNQQTMKQCGCVDAFTEALKIFLQGFKCPVQRQLIRSGVRQYLHRMVVCLEEEIFPFIPVILENLLQQPDAKELHDFIPLMTQLIMKFKKTISPFLREMFCPFVQTIYRVLSIPQDEYDQVTANEKRLLQKSYFQFLACIVSNNVHEVIQDQEAANFHQVLMTIVEGACNNPDPQIQKICFGILKRLIEVWCGENGLVGFEEFVYQSVVPACILTPMKPAFDLNDAQTVIALGESAQCLKCILDKRGDEVINYLQNEYFPKLQLSPDLTQQFCQAYVMDIKSFKHFLKTFFSSLKS